MLLTLAELVAGFDVALCCGLPFMPAKLGLGTAWLRGFALLAAPHRVFLLAAAAAAVCLAVAVLPWRQRSVVACAQVRSVRARGVTLISLLIGFVLLYLGYASLEVSMNAKSTITCPTCGASKTETQNENAVP